MYNQEYLQDLINNKIEESLNLEYKAVDSLVRTDLNIKEISKDVSAFANSDGGIIIYGIKEDPMIRHLPISIDPLDRAIIKKEWLENIIQARIKPRIGGIIIHPIEIDNDPMKVVFLIEIPKSSTAHQADDKKYYKRFNFKSEPMYDYEIRDIMNRLKTPKISLEFLIERTLPKDNQSSYPNNQPDLYLQVFAINNGTVLAQYINCNLEIPSISLMPNNDDPCKTDISEFFLDNTIRDFIDLDHWRPRYGPSRYDPILPRQKMKLRNDIPKLNQIRTFFEKEIKWTVYADNAEPQTGILKFHDIQIFDK